MCRQARVPTAMQCGRSSWCTGCRGDLRLTGDQFSVNSVALVDAQNPNSNTFNSTISNLGTLVTSTNPTFVNQLGVDADLIQLANAGNAVLANNATSATLNFTSTGD